MGVAYVSNVAARSTQKHQNLWPGVVQLVNDNGVFIVGQTSGFSTCAIPLQVMMDYGA